MHSKQVTTPAKCCLESYLASRTMVPYLLSLRPPASAAVRGWTEGGGRDHKGNGETRMGEGETRGVRERPEGVKKT